MERRRRSATTSRSRSSSAGDPGNSDAVWPSGPRPRCTRSIGPCSRRSGVVRLAAASSIVSPACRIEWTARGSTWSRKAMPGHALVGVGVADRHPALVAEEHVDLAPVDVGDREQLVGLRARLIRRRARAMPAPPRRRAPRTPAGRASTTRSSPRRLTVSATCRRSSGRGSVVGLVRAPACRPDRRRAGRCRRRTRR